MSENNRATIKWMVTIIIMVIVTCISATFAFVNGSQKEWRTQCTQDIAENKDHLNYVNGDIREIKNEIKHINKNLEEIKELIRK